MFNLNYEIHPSQMKRILIQAMTYSVFLRAIWSFDSLLFPSNTLII